VECLREKGGGIGRGRDESPHFPWGFIFLHKD